MSSLSCYNLYHVTDVELYWCVFVCSRVYFFLRGGVSPLYYYPAAGGGAGGGRLERTAALRNLINTLHQRPSPASPPAPLAELG